MRARRAYSMTVRDQKAAATRQRIVDVARELFTASTAFTLDEVARRADTSVQTVLRAFGSKERLVVAAIGTIREDAPDRGEVPTSMPEAIDQLLDDYEEIGDRVIRMLAEEGRIPEFATAAEIGRAQHRGWVEAAFASGLEALPPRERRDATTALVAATDVYVWKLLRRDLGLDRTAAQAAVTRLVRGALSSAGSTTTKEN